MHRSNPPPHAHAVAEIAAFVALLVAIWGVVLSTYAAQIGALA